MKARSLIIKLSLILMSAAGAAAALTACTSPLTTGIYYGCPYSKRISKLNLKKKRIK